jgi:hypothetical protein
VLAINVRDEDWQKGVYITTTRRGGEGRGGAGNDDDSRENR